MVPSLVDLCVKKWIDNVWSLANVGEIDEYLLDLMLPLCSVDQLKYVEGATKVSQGIDLSSVTDKLWRTFYEARFGNTDGVIEKMRDNNIPFKWKQAYEYKEEEIKARELTMRLLLEKDEYDYCGAGYIRMNSLAREEIDSLNSEEEDDDDDYDDEVVVDEESDVEGEVSVEEVEEDEETETDIEEVVEKEGEVSAEEVEEVEEEEQTQIDLKLSC
ncbi:uncharacterized protein LOC114734981 [Neltuma alba]|uniref:uncharacterized protein LOC114734981 n=1 Tax=Neltuma alba TaxID=207710 RepID=UPI0010A53C0A|nr:uncharacterized protein LOC114734981 [Prosopis alba]